MQEKIPKSRIQRGRELPGRNAEQEKELPESIECRQRNAEKSDRNAEENGGTPRIHSRQNLERDTQCHDPASHTECLQRPRPTHP